MTTVVVGATPTKSHKLWGGRFADGPAPAFDALNSSISVDFRLWPFDVQLSKAWAMALYNANVLTLDECNEIESGLDAVARRLDLGEQPAAGDEDVHTLIDRLLHDEIGDAASKLHTGRSRNDQVATATRLWAMEAANRLDVAVRGLERVMIDQAHGLETALMPSYTAGRTLGLIAGAIEFVQVFFSPRAPSRPRPSNASGMTEMSARNAIADA